MLSNNLANVNTTGYKADIPVFRVGSAQATAPADSIQMSGRLSPFAPPMEARTDFMAGSLIQTGNPLDVAIVGKGFFEVQAPEGTRFTRKGNFIINEQGQLSTIEGWPVMGQGGAIAVDGSRIEIGDEGQLSVDGEPVDTLRIVDFPEPYQLKKTGDSFFAPDPGIEPSNVEEGTAQLAQGFVEQSNVNAIRTMTELIETLRVFEAYQRVIRNVDDMTSKTVNEVGRSA